MNLSVKNAAYLLFISFQQLPKELIYVNRTEYRPNTDFSINNIKAKLEIHQEQ